MGRLLRMHANKREEIESIEAGDIAACVGLKNVTTGDTLCSEDKPIVLENIDFPAPVISVAIEPKTKADQEKMGIALGKLAQEDPTFRVHTDHDTDQTLISGMGELHLEIIVDRMMREFSVQANVGRPQVAYRETILKVAEGEGKYIKQTGGRGQYGHVKLTVQPLAERRARGHARDVHRRNRRAGKEGCGQGRQVALRQGTSTAVHRQGYRRRRFQENSSLRSKTACAKRWKPAFSRATKWWICAVVLEDGSYHDVDSSEMAFKIAGSMAFKEACKRANPKLLEPIMRVEVVVPEDYMGPVIADLNSRRGQLQGTRIARGHRDYQRAGAAGRDVRLRDRYSQPDAGTRQLHDAFFALPADARKHRGRNDWRQATGRTGEDRDPGN